MKTEKTPYEKQIFVCTNDKKGEGASCGDHQGEEVFRQLRQIAKDRGFHPRIRIAQAKCLGQCAKGVNIMSYPDNDWYCEVKPSDVPALAQKFFPPQA